MGKLYRLQATVAGYYWSSDGEPDVLDLSRTADALMRYSGDTAECSLDDVTEVAADELDDLVYGDHEGDMTVAQALARQRAAEAEAAADADSRQGTLL